MIFSCFIKIVFTLPNSKIEQSAKKSVCLPLFQSARTNHVRDENSSCYFLKKLVNSGEFAQRSYVLSTLRRRNQWGKNFWKTLLFFFIFVKLKMRTDFPVPVPFQSG